MLNVTDVLALADVTLTGTQSHPIYIFLHYGTLLGNPLCHYPGRSDLADGHWEGFLSDDIDSDVFQYRMIEIAFEFSPRSG